MKYELSSKQQTLLRKVITYRCADLDSYIMHSERSPRTVERDKHIAGLQSERAELVAIIEIIKPVSRKGKQ